MVDGFFHIAPSLVRPLVANIARRGVRQTYHLQGLGRHSRNEEEAFARKDLQALNDAIQPQGFLLGDEVTVYDCAVAAILAGLFDQQPPTWLNAVAAPFTELRDYAERVQTAVGVFGRPV